MRKPELRPCPFCGMEPTFGSYTVGTLRKMTLYRAACENRNCKVQPVGFPHHNAARARSNWNIRSEEGR